MAFDEEYDPMEDFYAKAAEARTLIVRMQKALDFIVFDMEIDAVEERTSPQELHHVAEDALAACDAWLEAHPS